LITNTVLETGYQSTELPVIRFETVADVTDVSPSGEMLISFEIVDGRGLNDVSGERLKKDLSKVLAAMKGLRVGWKMSPRGELAPLVRAASPDSGLDAAEILRDTSVVFPSEPVGAGARWQIASTIKRNGIEWSRTQTFRLKRASEDEVEIEVATVMRAKEQDLAVEPSRTRRLSSASLDATAELTVPLEGIAPSGHLRSVEQSEIVVVSGSLRLTSKNQTELRTEIRRVP
jgi:hypothetical protein